MVASYEQSPCLSSRFSSKDILRIAIVMTALVLPSVKSASPTCSLQLENPEINYPSAGLIIQFNPSLASLYVETGIKIVLPAAMGFSYTSQLQCFESNPNLQTSSFIAKSPICSVFYDITPATFGNVIIQITNLATSTIPPFYGVRAIGLKNGPSATSLAPGSSFCTSHLNNQFTVPKETAVISALQFSPVYLNTGVNIQGTPSQNNAIGVIKVIFQVTNPVPIQGSMNMQFPAQNSQINVATFLTSESAISMLPSSSQELSASGSFSIAGSPGALSPSPDSLYVSTAIGTGQVFEMNLRLGNTEIIPIGAVITIILNGCKMPPTLAPLTGFIISTQDEFFNSIEIGPSLSLTNTAPGVDQSGQSKAFIESNQGVLAKDATYNFQIQAVGNIPVGGYFTLKVPLAVGLPADVETMLIMKCIYFCQPVQPTLDPNDLSGRTLLFQGVYPSISAYLSAPGPIQFTLKGFTNPASTAAAYFQWTSYAVLGVPVASYKIDQLSTLNIQAVQGACTISNMYATDNNTMIYGIASNWTVTMSCEHPVTSEYGLVMTFPTDLLVISTTNCEVGLQNSGYSCVADSNAKTVTLFAFTNSVIDGANEFTFTFNSIRNSPVTKLAYTVSFFTQAPGGGKIDLGSYTIPNTYFTYGTIWKFSVVPSSQGVGQYPVFYNFTIQPSGEIPIGSYFEITLPPTVVVYDERAIEQQCSYSISGFTNAAINCQVNAQARLITILSGFSYKNTSNMLIGNAMVPPTIKFSIPQMQNPRTMTYTDAFSVKIFNSASIAIYAWNNTNYVTSNGVFTTEVLSGPVVRMSTPAAPQSVVYSRVSSQNGNLTTYTFAVTPTNYATEGDQITLTLPYPVFFTLQSQVYGVSSNLRLNLTGKVSQDLTSITISLLMPIKFRRLQGGSVYVIKAGEAFQFNITNIKNPISYQPTSQSITYAASTGGNMIEKLTFSSLLQITNNKPGIFNVSQTSFMPQDFRPSYANNYTLILKPINYEQNMRIVVTIPKEISLASNSIACIGLAGTDAQMLTCSLNITAKVITITNAVTFQKANPGTIKILFSQLKNPTSNIVTSSIQVQTYTATGYLIDDLSTGLSINFFCQYPCQNCDSKINSKCTQCYAGSDYQIFFNSTCLLQCPNGYINTTTNNCTSCSSPCASCKTDKITCTSCIAGHRLKANKCFEIVYYPFPFAIFGIICFMIVTLSEIMTKTGSKFKEAFMALLSLAEIGSWITLTVFLYFRLGYLGYSFIGCAAAVVFSFLLNFIFIGIHQRLIIPNSLTSYKRVIDEHKFLTYSILTVSYAISYRLSLLSVSYLFKKPQFSGDFSLLNQRHFNRLSLVYIILPYPAMMLSVAYFVYTDGIFSYAGFVCIEVVAISTVMFCMMAVDAMTGCRCNIPKERRAYQTSKVTQGADYESEDDQPGKRLVKRRKEGGDEFGADEDIQNEASDTMAKLKGTQVFDVRSNASIVDEETKRQIAMLEELARQMREEKEQLRLEKDRIERERHLMLTDKDQQLQKMQNYLSDYQNQTKLLKGQVDSIQKSKAQLVTQVQDKLNEGVEHNKRLLEQQMQQQKLLQKKAYRDIEGEMEDYDPVDEAEQDEEDSVIEEAAELPQPVAGQINYFRRLDGDEQYWLQQITPRAGGDSIMGQHDRDDEGQYQVMANKAAHYDAGTVPPSRHNREEYMMRSDASYSQINMVRLIEDAEIYRHQADAEMEVDSDRGGANSVQEYFQNENAHFEVEDPRTPLTQKVQYMVKEKAEFETLDDKMSRNGSERQFLAQEQAAKGEVDLPRSQYAGSTQQYLKNEDATYRNLASEGPVVREGTPVQYFDVDRASAGRGTEYDRDKVTQQNYLQREDPHYIDQSSTRNAETNQQYMAKDNPLQRDQRGSTRNAEANQEYLVREPAVRENVSGLNAIEDTTRMYQLDRASQGRTSTIEKSDNEQAFIGQSAEFGKASEYDRKIGAAQNFRPVQQVLEDQSGHSESSEGIVDHNPFSQAKDDNIANKKQAKQQARQSIRQEIAPVTRPGAKPEAQAKQSPPTNQPAGKKKKTIIYSDKSESSIDDMMGDTPSNYNIPNGRLDGKSLGLKAILLHAQNHTGRDLDNAQKKAGGSPRVAQNNNQFGQASRTNESEERKFVNNLHQRQGAATLDTSHDGGWGNLNQPLGSKRTHVIGEESADERTSGQQKKKQIKTNKQFAEPAPGRGGVNGIAKLNNQTPKPGQQQPQLAKVKTNNFV